MSEKNQTYLAVTIGPIYRTLGEARKVRHLWGASYLFSRLMKAIIEQVDSPQAKPFFERLLPRYDTSVTQKNGVGLFPDRLFLRVKPERETAATNMLNTCLQNAVNSLAYGYQYTDALWAYLQTYAVQIELAQGANYVMPLNQLLDGLELAPKAGVPVLFDVKDYVEHALPYFYKEAFVDKRKQFETVTEIAAKDLEGLIPDYEDFIVDYREKIGSKQEDDFFKMLMAQGGEHKTVKEHLRQYHKYVAIVHADGDSIGKTLEKIGGNDAQLENFSKRLFAFAQEAAKVIDNWGGMPIYAGGDDLLFLAPVVAGNETIFKLLNNLRDVFHTEVVLNAAFLNEPTPTLSFGVNMIYHKFPLAEGREQSADELFKTAKGFKGKNCTSFRVQKHSGSDFGGIIPHDLLDSNSALASMLLKSPGKDSEKFFRSVMYTLQEFDYLLEPIVGDSERLSAFFDNHFNESVHKTKAAKAQLKTLQVLIEESFKRQPESAKKALESVFGILRFIQFIQTDFQS